MAELIEIRVPDIGDSKDVNVAEIYVKLGDKVAIDDNLIMLETDKASMDVPSTYAGEVSEIKVQVGSKINQGDLIIILKAESSAATVNTKPQEQQQVSPPKVEEQTKKDNLPQVLDKPITAPNPVVNSPTQEYNFKNVIASPSIRKLARELGANLNLIKGSGTKGRITESDVKLWVKDQLSSNNSSNKFSNTNLNLLPWPSVDFAKYGPIEVKELSKIKKISGANLWRNWVMIPHVTQFDEADITELEEFRKKINEEYKKSEVKVSPLAFIIKASIVALKRFPEFNSSIENDSIIYKQYYNIGFAADTPNGLVVPVLKNADTKGVIDIAIETANLAKLAREGKLKAADMQGGSFTISSLGGIGGTAFTPIINAPEVAILGLSKSAIKPVWNGNEFKPRLILPLSLSYDHRVIDGALAAKFTAYLSLLISDIRRLGL
ncbi:MAG: dihydrolipoyllysine-residue acetyltransferase [Burkholderiales bacterium]|nr:dihydrolipoyllysine-residue acetyltransferase [Burkholderiales bacterium]